MVHEHLRLKAPSAMPPVYAAIMEACWEEDPEKRCILGSSFYIHIEQYMLCVGVVAGFSPNFLQGGCRGAVSVARCCFGA